MTLGEMLALARELKKMSLRDLEKKSGVSNGLLSQIETGHIQDPGFRTVCKIALALGVKLDRLAKLD